MTRSRVVMAVAFVAMLGAMAWPAQDSGWTQAANYALVRSLADGRPRIDRYRNETGDLLYLDGHYDAAKARRVALVTLPVYVTLDAAGLWPNSLPRALSLLPTFVAAVIPALLLMALVIRVAERFEPGSGLAVGADARPRHDDPAVRNR